MQRLHTAFGILPYIRRGIFHNKSEFSLPQTSRPLPSAILHFMELTAYPAITKRCVPHCPMYLLRPLPTPDTECIPQPPPSCRWDTHQDMYHPWPPPGHPRRSRTPQDTPDAPGRPRTPQDAPGRPRTPQDAPRRPQDTPGRPRTPQATPEPREPFVRTSHAKPLVMTPAKAAWTPSPV